jgi:hypothetical protein
MNQEMMEQPKGIRVMAVLHLVVALAGIFRIGADLAAMKKVGQLRPLKDAGNSETLIEAYVAYAQAASGYELVDILAALILAGLLIGAGVMLFRGRWLGWTWSLAYAITSVALRVGLTVWYAYGVHPKHVAYLTVLHAEVSGTASLMPIPSSSGWWVGVLISSIYPVWVWRYLRKEEVRYYLED